jgi:CheY-like chemotaxis protein
MKPEAGPEMERKRLLAVDDDAGILAIISNVAGGLGFDVETISSSARFMAAYVRLRPHVITLDLMMPDVDGVELVRWLGDVGCTAGLVIISGGHGTYLQMTQKLAAAKGILRTGVLAKPFGIADLRNALLAAADETAAIGSAARHVRHGGADPAN